MLLECCSRLAPLDINR